MMRKIKLVVACVAVAGQVHASPITYWNLFNIEGESAIPANLVTYSTLTDMLNDTNRTGNFVPGSFAKNIVGSGASVHTAPVPEPSSIVLLGIGSIGLFGYGYRRKRKHAA